jgi:hypothetical protein
MTAHRFIFSKIHIISISFAFVAGMVLMAAAPEAWGMGPPNPSPSGYETLCWTKSSMGAGKKADEGAISMEAKLKTGKKPLLIEFTSTVDNALDFDGGTAKWVIVENIEGLTFDHILVSTDSSEGDCVATNIQVVYKDSNNNDVVKDLDDEGVFNANLLEDTFNGLMDVLGFPDVEIPDVPEGGEADVAVDVCEEIQNQLINGNTLGLSTFADLGSLMGAMASTQGRCLGESNIVQIVDVQGVEQCTGDDIAATLALQLLQAAPEYVVQAQSSGDGTYTVTNLTPDNDDFDSLQISFHSDGTCSASGE